MICWRPGVKTPKGKRVAEELESYRVRKEVEFGIHLTGERRAAVARQLKEHLKIG